MKIHMIGVGGIGMSALAQLYARLGHAVSGSDREASPTTELLKKKGMRVLIPQQSGQIPEGTELVVYSDAVWDDNPERADAKQRGIRQISYFRALGEATEHATVVAVTGTHGKTTTTALLAKVLRDAGKNPSAVIGSIVPEFGSNFLAGSPDLYVIEGCEYKDHVLELSPNILVLTNAEWDHTDWFPSLSAMQLMFKKAVHKLPTDGAVVANLADPNIAPVVEGARSQVIDYAGMSVPKLLLHGAFNEMNARAAKAGAKALFPDIADSAIDGSLASFKGTWRRFEYKGEGPNGAFIYDDYAHHPTAIRETLAALRARHSHARVTLVFHPHLYTRTRDLFEGFVEELSQADRVIMAPIYPAREEAIPGVTSDALADAIRKNGGNAISLPTFDAIEAEVRKNASKNDVIMTIGAGDVYKVADALVQ